MPDFGNLPVYQPDCRPLVKTERRDPATASQSSRVCSPSVGAASMSRTGSVTPSSRLILRTSRVMSRESPPWAKKSAPSEGSGKPSRSPQPRTSTWRMSPVVTTVRREPRRAERSREACTSATWSPRLRRDSSRSDTVTPNLSVILRTSRVISSVSPPRAKKSECSVRSERPRSSLHAPTMNSPTSPSRCSSPSGPFGAPDPAERFRPETAERSLVTFATSRGMCRLHRLPATVREHMLHGNTFPSRWQPSLPSTHCSWARCVGIRGPQVCQAARDRHTLWHNWNE
uniref:Uncharacterized protein n=1 Tax=Streptomyces globisporus TaxID=1908 RepID=Q8GMF2_STRGL|nr:unknown [Streptomyces globisporus]